MSEANPDSPTVKTFCVGQAKSGTASLCGLLARHFRAAHEPEREQTLEMILRRARGMIDEEGLVDYLIRRDRRLKLEYDIAWANQFLINPILYAFPNATFVMLIRDPYTWLQSIVGHLVDREVPPDVRLFLDWWFKPECFPHSHHDRKLQTAGVYSIAAFLNVWNQHVDSCTRILPRERLLILKTHELGRSHSQLAEFLQIPIESLDPQNGYLNRGRWSGRLESMVDGFYLNDMVGQICGDNMVCHFPEVSGIDDVKRLWGPG